MSSVKKGLSSFRPKSEKSVLIMSLSLFCKYFSLSVKAKNVSITSTACACLDDPHGVELTGLSEGKSYNIFLTYNDFDINCDIVKY